MTAPTGPEKADDSLEIVYSALTPADEQDDMCWFPSVYANNINNRTTASQH